MAPIHLVLTQQDQHWCAAYTQRGRVFQVGCGFTEREAAAEACFYHLQIRQLKRRTKPAEETAVPRRREPTMTLATRHKQAPRANERRMGCKGVIEQGGGFIVKFRSSGTQYNFGWFKSKEEAIREYDKQILRIRGETAITNRPMEEIIREAATNSP